MKKSPLEKTDTNIQKNKMSSKIEDRVPMIRNICDGLFQSSINFDAKKSFDEIRQYVMKHERFLYSIISNYIFHEVQNEGQFDVFSSNIENLYEYMESLDEAEFEKSEFERMDKAVLKLYDHVNLAYRQFVDLKVSEDEFERKFKKNVAPFEAKLTREMSAQLLTLISIFTALAFLVFGGITSLENLFSHTEIPLLKIIVIGAIWGLCMLNLIFVFLICVSKMTKITFEATSSPEANLFQKYPIIWWTNLIILSVFVLSIWVYYISQNGTSEWFESFCINHSKTMCIFGTLFIVCTICFLAYKLNQVSKQKKKQE